MVLKKRKKAAKGIGNAPEGATPTRTPEVTAGKTKKRKAGAEATETAASKPEASAVKAKKGKAGQEAIEPAESKPATAAKKRKAGSAATEPAASKPEATAGKAKKRKAGAVGAEAANSKPDAAGETQQGAGSEVKGSKKPKEAGSAKDASKGGDLTVFVDGVPYDWTIERIKEFFVTKCGSVDDVRAPTWQDSGRLRGYAHVAFTDAGGKEKALKLNGTKVGKKGRYLKIDPAKKPAEGKNVSKEEIEGKRRLFVKNLPYDASEDDIAKVFAKCGKVVEIRIPHASGRSKGFAYVEFAKAQGLKAAMELDPAPSLKGRKLHLDADSGSGPKAGFHHRPDAFQSKFVAKGKHGKGKGKGRPPSLF